jgi:hypothetical protein
MKTMSTELISPKKIPIEEVEEALHVSLGNHYSIRRKAGTGLLIEDKLNSRLSRGHLQTSTILVARNRWAGSRLRVYTIRERETCFDIEPHLPSRLAQIIGILPFALPALALVLFLRPEGWLSQMRWPLGLLVSGVSTMALAYVSVYLRYAKCWPVCKVVEKVLKPLTIATLSPDAVKECPTCGAQYRPSDYTKASPMWCCSSCESQIPKE